MSGILLCEYRIYRVLDLAELTFLWEIAKTKLGGLCLMGAHKKGTYRLIRWFHEGTVI